MSDMTPFEQTIGQHVLNIAADIEEHYEAHGDEEVLDSIPPLYELSPDTVEFHEETLDDDERGPSILVLADTTGIRTKKERSATYNPPGQAHPAEYSHHEEAVGVSVCFFPLDGSFGSADIRIEQM